MTTNEAILLSMQVYGLAIVISLLVAVVVRGVVSTLSVLEKKADAPAPSAVSTMVDEDDEDHIVAISAAVWAMIGPHRIVHIESRGRGRIWTAEGRFAHHASHTVGHPRSSSGARR
uniref:Oxaloacetate decarboxylase, gamma chain n=1 Tax=Candidatus Kentrum sp. FM TaxID=2126340 RepID=A0A450TTG7_9GAMM|nr:MAG: hypothetical protein BECKFM1743A_GA0114220_105772 [Candidatus Kentron sp. FM]VFJ71788.1 MAG: hypothetical protein BECKFM1743C_GA0114222_106131 [Candidatus Kentron sp. FM]VFK19157.1 MAG: hypothetical protein BECKFM1743B_GA0114221_106001 [Candidatus Kentron sp. FM]